MYFTMNNACDTVSRKARWLRYAVIAVGAFIVAANGLLAWRSMADHPHVLSFVQLEVSGDLAAYPRLALLASVLASLIYLYSLYRLVALMRLFERGQFFCVQATRHLRAFSASLLLATVAGCLLPPLELMLARALGFNHLHAVSIQLDSSDIGMILISALFFLIAWILSEARQLAEDNQLII
jgi:hypothetical protein